jgi:hypothetical protein
MLRYILNAIFLLFIVRTVIWFARMLTARHDQGPRLDESPQNAERRARLRVERTDAVDVPFTEIPPEKRAE